MKPVLILLLAAAGASARPQRSVICLTRQNPSGGYEIDCNGDPITIVDEKTLWIPTNRLDSELVIRVPNYNLKQFLRTGLISGGSDTTNVRVHVARPQINSVVEADNFETGRLAANVQVSYEGINNRGEVHYGGTGEVYRPLSKPITEPGTRGRY